MTLVMTAIHGHSVVGGGMMLLMNWANAIGAAGGARKGGGSQRRVEEDHSKKTQAGCNPAGAAMRLVVHAHKNYEPGS